MQSKESIKRQIEQAIHVKEQILNDELFTSKIEQAAILCSDALRRGNKILLAGNGGSAADAQHIAAELVNRFGFDRPALAAVSLTTDSSVLTSISNDYGYNRIIARQVEAIGTRGDILIVISTSGSSENILEGISEAGKKGITTIGLTGRSGGRMKDSCDLMINVPSDETPRIQEAHIMIGHIICSIIETSLFGTNNTVE
ncbi:MAG: D-sedoheptulose 7-phosphate isomerase [Bacteroidales bacterium]|jgi:D-sedoheptulose 7-phosphate isomerase